MLEERDRRALDAMEQQLRAADPAFVARMDAGRPGRPFPAVSAVCAAAFLSMPFVALFLGPTAALVMADVAAVAVVMILIRRRRREHRGGQ